MRLHAYRSNKRCKPTGQITKGTKKINYSPNWYKRKFWGYILSQFFHFEISELMFLFSSSYKLFQHELWRVPHREEALSLHDIEESRDPEHKEQSKLGVQVSQSLRLLIIAISDVPPQFLHNQEIVRSPNSLRSIWFFEPTRFEPEHYTQLSPTQTFVYTHMCSLYSPQISYFSYEICVAHSCHL